MRKTRYVPNVAFKIPQHIWFRFPPLPSGASDKLDRRELSAQHLNTLN